MLAFRLGKALSVVTRQKYFEGGAESDVNSTSNFIKVHEPPMQRELVVVVVCVFVTEPDQQPRARSP